MNLLNKIRQFARLLVVYHWLAKLTLEFILYLEKGRKAEDAKKILDNLIEPFEKIKTERSKE